MIRDPLSTTLEELARDSMPLAKGNADVRLGCPCCGASIPDCATECPSCGYVPVGPPLSRASTLEEVAAKAAAAYLLYVFVVAPDGIVRIRAFKVKP